MSVKKLIELLTLLPEEGYRFDREFDIEADGNALVVDVQDVSVLRVYQQPHDTWQSADLAEFVVLAKEMMPQLLIAVVYLRDIVYYQKPSDEQAEVMFAGAADLLEKIYHEEKAQIELKYEPIQMQMDDGRNFGIKVVENGTVVAENWFKNEIFRDLALIHLKNGESDKILAHWHFIGTEKTRVFADPMTGSAFFVLDDALLGAPTNMDDSLFCPAEVFSPDEMPKYQHEFIKLLLTDDDYQMNYPHTMFYDVFTDELRTSVIKNLTGNLQSVKVAYIL